MALVGSTMTELGSIAPDFTLPDTLSQQTMSLSTLKSDIGTVVMFICNHCPYVMRINQRLSEVAQQYQPMGIQFVAISANDISRYPQDSPERMKELAEKYDFPFPYLYDESQAVARAYQATCTPDFFVYNANLELVYRGRFDETTLNQGTATGQDLMNALDSLIRDEPISTEQYPSQGCSIKWK